MLSTIFCRTIDFARIRLEDRTNSCASRTDNTSGLTTTTLGTVTNNDTGEMSLTLS